MKFRIFALISLLLIVSCTSAAASEHGLKTVVIDPGHGGKDPGAPKFKVAMVEKEVVLDISLRLGNKIKQEFPDVKVVYTRSSDASVTLKRRWETAAENDADFFISIHCNANSNRSMKGSSAHILSRKDTRDSSRDLFSENLELTQLENEAINYEEDKSVYVDNTPESHIMKALQFGANYNYSIMFSKLLMENLATSPFKKWGRGIHQNDFYLLKKMTCPAVLVETAFISNPDEYQLLASAKWREEIAERLFKAFKEFKKAYDESVSSPVNEDVNNDASTSAAESAYYSIQVMGLGRRLSSTDPAFKGLPCAAVKVPSSNIYKYVYGNFISVQEARNSLDEVKKKFPDAFVVKVDNGNILRIN